MRRPTAAMFELTADGAGPRGSRDVGCDSRRRVDGCDSRGADHTPTLLSVVATALVLTLLILAAVMA